MKNYRRILFFLILVFSLILTWSLSPLVARAGFGISPPYVRNRNLTRGSHFEQKIILVRDNPSEDWQAELVFNVPGINNWFTIDKGKKFILPKGEKQVPIIINVDVPKDAEYKEYKGFIRVKTNPLKAKELGTVNIILGGQIDVDLNVTKNVLNFRIRGVKILNSEEGHKWLLWFFPGIVRFSMQVENMGNVKARPSKIDFDIYDNQGKTLLEKYKISDIREAVEPFKTKWITVKIPTKLKPGSYWVRYKIYKQDEINGQGRLHLTILPAGTIAGYRGANILDLAPKDKLTMILLILTILGGIGWGLAKIISRQKKEKKV